MFKVVGIVFIVLVAGFGIWLGSHFKPSPDYSREAVCTAAEIDATYAAIEDIGDWHSAAIMRTNYEAGLRPRERTIRDHITRALTMVVAKHFGHRMTATALCGHTYVRFNNSKPMMTVPAVAEALKPKLGDAPDRGKIATCFALRGGWTPLDLETADPQRFRYACALREANASRYN
jgi:hypothetical protein